jgi:hypothetical protein
VRSDPSCVDSRVADPESAAGHHGVRREEPVEKGQALLRELKNEADEKYRAGRVHNLTDSALSVAAVITSFLATVLAATGHTTTAAVAAAVPAICVSMQKAVDHKGRASWYFAKGARLRRLALRLEYGGEPVEEVADALGLLEEEMEDQWSRYVRSWQAEPEGKGAEAGKGRQPGPAGQERSHGQPRAPASSSRARQA